MKSIERLKQEINECDREIERRRQRIEMLKKELEKIKNEPIGIIVALQLWQEDENRAKTNGGCFLDGWRKCEENEKLRYKPLLSQIKRMSDERGKLPYQIGFDLILDILGEFDKLNNGN